MNCPNCNSKKVILEGSGLFDSVYEAWICEKCGHYFMVQSHGGMIMNATDEAERIYQGYGGLENYENYEG